MNVIPMSVAFYNSFTDFNLLYPKDTKFIGLENFEKLFTIKAVEIDAEGEYYHVLLEEKLIPIYQFSIRGIKYAVGAREPLFWKSIYNTLFIIIIGLPLQIAIAFIISYLVSTDRLAIGIFRSLIYLPVLVPPVVVGVVWKIVLNPRFGPVNAALGRLWIDGPNWSRDPAWTKPAIILIMLWSVGGSMLILMAAIKDVPKDYYEAAELDGANWIQKMTRITIPLTSPAILFVTITGIIFGFQTFTIPYVYSGPTGQPDDSLLFFTMNLYNHAVAYNNMGKASALGVVLFLITMAFTFLILRFSRQFVYYRS